MTESNLIQIKEQLKTLGFAEIVDEVELYAKPNLLSFSLYHSNRIKDNQLIYELRFNKQGDNVFRFTQYELTIQSVPIPKVVIAGVDTKELETRMEWLIISHYTL